MVDSTLLSSGISDGSRGVSSGVVDATVIKFEPNFSVSLYALLLWLEVEAEDAVMTKIVRKKRMIPKVEKMVGLIIWCMY